MTAQFAFDPVLARAALDQMKSAGDGPVAIGGDTWAHGAMAALIQAELLAAQAGLVPWFELPDGQRGIVTVGAAREHLDRAPEDVRTIYLATHGIVRRTHAEATPWNGSTPMLGELEPELGEPVTLIMLAVVAIAAIVAGAWYLERKSAIEIEGRNARTAALVAGVSELAREQLEKTGRIDPGVWAAFGDIAAAERDSPWPYVMLGGVAVVGAAGVYVLHRWKKSRSEVKSS